MNRPSDVLSPIEVNALVDALFYKLNPEQRGFVMANCPVAYSKLFPGTREAVTTEVSSALLEVLSGRK